MAVSVEQVKELREKTSAGVLECKKALMETGGDMDRALTVLRGARVSRCGQESWTSHSGGNHRLVYPCGRETGSSSGGELRDRLRGSHG